MILVKLLNSVVFYKCIYKDLIMATFPWKSYKRRCKKKKKIIITCPYGHNFSYLQKYTYMNTITSKQYVAKSLKETFKDA